MAPRASIVVPDRAWLAVQLLLFAGHRDDYRWSGIFDATERLGVPIWLLIEGFEQFGV